MLKLSDMMSIVLYAWMQVAQDILNALMTYRDTTDYAEWDVIRRSISASGGVPPTVKEYGTLTRVLADTIESEGDWVEEFGCAECETLMEKEKVKVCWYYGRRVDRDIVRVTVSLCACLSF